MENLKEKPTVQLSGQDGNIFSIMARCSRALKQSGMRDEADQMVAEITQSNSYDEALQVVMKYVEVQ